MHDSYPLDWPEGWNRTRPQDRKPQAQWKKTAQEYRESLITEFERLKAPSCVISCNVELNMRGRMTSVDPLDPGVAVYFSREGKEDFGWQDALGIHEPAPSVDRIQSAFKERAKIYHPDAPHGDLKMFQSLAGHRDNAIAWVTRKSNQKHDYVIACDQFKEVRLNMCAIRLTIAAIRTIERCGTSTLLERAFRGFEALPKTAGESHP